MHYCDLARESQAACGHEVRAVGWLAAETPYATGSSGPHFLTVLRAHLADPFQQGRANPGGFRTVDIWNNTLDLYVTSRWPRGEG